MQLHRFHFCWLLCIIALAAPGSSADPEEGKDVGCVRRERFPMASFFYTQKRQRMTQTMGIERSRHSTI